MLNLVLGTAVGLGVSFIWIYAVVIVFAKVLEIKNDKIIMIIGFAPIIFLWHNGNQTWEPYGEFDLLHAFVSILTLPWEIAGGLENLLGLETGTLGGWPNI